MNKSGKYLVWTVLAVMGAFALGYIALNRGEQINALWIVVASVCIYLIAYRFYGLYIAKNVLAVDPTRMTPAVRHNDGLDYVPTDKKVLFGHHFAAIAGAGPLVGPVLAAQMGYLPGMIWLLAGVVLAGAVQDFMVLFVSTRRDGRSLGELVKEEMGPTAGVIALVACFMIMVIILAVLAMIVVKALTHSPWGTYTVAFTIPLLTSYKQVHYRATAGQAGEAIRGTFAELGSTFRAIRKNKPLWMFMIAFFFYIDAVNTVISMSTSYGTQLGIDSTQLVVALLVTQFVAFPCSIIYGKLAGRFGSKTMITAAVVAYMCIVFFAAFFLKSAVEFWILAILVGMFQGGIQALSRSYYGKIIPKDHANEYYGFYDIFGKTASILGTFLVATTTSITGNASLGVLSIAILLVLALIFLLLQKDPTQA